MIDETLVNFINQIGIEEWKSARLVLVLS